MFMALRILSFCGFALFTSAGGARPAVPDSQNIVRVYFNAVTWGGPNCRIDAADIALEDWHVYSTIMSGWRDGRSITLYVDDAVHLVAGDVTCRITAARVQ